jgi:hypothetical protein
LHAAANKPGSSCNSLMMSLNRWHASPKDANVG